MMWEKKNKKRLEKEWLDWFLSDNVTLLKTSNNSMQVAKHSFLPDKTKATCVTLNATFWLFSFIINFRYVPWNF